METTATQKRYIVEKPAHGGTWFEQYGWKVRDTQPLNPSCMFVMSGSERQAQRWARELNAMAAEMDS